MEFNFNTEALFKCDQDGISILESNYVNHTNKSIISVLDLMGEASSKVTS
jgi:hypothetical protein